MEQTQALPAGLLYSLLKGLDPKTLAAGEPRAPEGKKVDPTARQEFLAIAEAARKARSAAQFKKLTSVTAQEKDSRSHGAITSLLVYNRGDGGVFIQVVYADGVTYQAYYPPGTI